jgi:chromosome segregation ATPase
VQELSNKISQLQDQLKAVDGRIKDNIQAMAKLRPQVDASLSHLHEAKKSAALDPGSGKKTLESAQGKAAKVQGDLDSSIVLGEALTDEKTRIERELSQAKAALAAAEVELISAKAPRLLNEYNKAVRLAHRAVVALKVLNAEVQRRNGIKHLQSVCPEAAGYFQYFTIDNFTLIQEASNNRGYPVRLFDNDVDKADIVQELFAS